MCNAAGAENLGIRLCVMVAVDKSVVGSRPGNETYFVFLRAVFLVRCPPLLLPL